MLGDRVRPWLALAAALGLVACFGWWAWLHQTGALGYAVFEVHPERYDGQEVALSLVRVAAIDGPDRYHVEKGTLRLTVDGPSAGLELGEDLSVGGTWRAETRTLDQRWVERRERGRRAKRVLGVVALLGVGGLLVGRLRWGSGGLALSG